MKRYHGYIQEARYTYLYWKRVIVIDELNSDPLKSVLWALDYHLIISRLDLCTPIVITDEAGAVLYYRFASPDMLQKLPKRVKYHS